MPATRSWSMSRRLFASSTAHAQQTRRRPRRTTPPAAARAPAPMSCRASRRVRRRRRRTARRARSSRTAACRRCRTRRRRCRRRPTASSHHCCVRIMSARPATAAIAKNISATVEDSRAGPRLPRRRQARRADADVVGAADAVAVVVRVVHADLQATDDDEAEQREHPVEQVRRRSSRRPCRSGSGVTARGSVRSRAAPIQSRDGRLLRRAGGRATRSPSADCRAAGCLRGAGTLALLAGGACHEQSSYGVSARFPARATPWPVSGSRSRMAAC